MVEVDGEIYLIASEAAKYLGIPRGMFYYNVRARVQAYELAARRRLHYKQSDLEAFRNVKPVTSLPGNPEQVDSLRLVEVDS